MARRRSAGEEEALALDLFGGGEEEPPAEEPSRPGAHVPLSGRAEVPSAPTEVSSGRAGGAVREVYSVSQVNRAVRNLLEGTLPPVWVSGEVAGWKRVRSGHRYFTLKDDQSQLRCVMWRSEAERLPTDPEDGMELRAFGSLTLYEARGDYQLVVRTLEAAGAEGLWRLAFERLRGRLESEGLLDPARKRPLPPTPSVVGVVTSTSGAALHDILTTLRRRAPWTRVVVRGARVQGEGAALEIADAVRTLGRSGLVDVVLVSRGGGSIEDLWPFNEEPVARAIANCPVPVISAVGHEVDVTISDLVADVRAPTPSAGAELAVQGSALLVGGIRTLPPRMVRALLGAVERRKTTLRERKALLGRGLRAAATRRRTTLGRAGERLESAVRRALERRRQRLTAAAGRLDALSPLATLRRGYSVALDREGHLLSRVLDFPPGAPFLLRVADGTVACRSEGAAPGGEVADLGRDGGETG